MQLGLLKACAALTAANVAVTAADACSGSSSVFAASWHNLTVANRWWSIVTAQLRHDSASHLAANALALGIVTSLLPLGTVSPAALTGIYLASGVVGTAGSISHTLIYFSPPEEARLASSLQEFNQMVRRNGLALDRQISILRNRIAASRGSIGFEGEPVSQQQRLQEMEQLAVPQRLRPGLLTIGSQFPAVSTHTLRRLLVASKGVVPDAIVRLRNEESRGRLPADDTLLPQVAHLEQLEQPYQRWALESTREVMGGSAGVYGVSAAVCVQHAQLLVRRAHSITSFLRPTPSLAIFLGCTLIPICDAWLPVGRSQFDHVAHMFGWAGGLVMSSTIVCLSPTTIRV